MAAQRNGRGPSDPGSVDAAGVQAPDSIDRPALTLDQAAGLMAGLGFLAFRTPAEVPDADSCLMVVIRDTPTRRHFDPETVGYWIIERGRGVKEVIDRDVATPFVRRFSWGTIRLQDRFGVRNEFVAFGGWLSGERVGPDAVLLIFRSAAPILRLPGHSQPGDRLAEEALVFFGHLVPRLWDPSVEQAVGTTPADELWAAFLVHEEARMDRSAGLRDALASDAGALARELRRAARRPAALAAGHRLLERVGLQA